MYEYLTTHFCTSTPESALPDKALLLQSCSLNHFITRPRGADVHYEWGERESPAEVGVSRGEQVTQPAAQHEHVGGETNLLFESGVIGVQEGLHLLHWLRTYQSTSSLAATNDPATNRPLVGLSAE